jgi:hypothetical protein
MGDRFHEIITSRERLRQIIPQPSHAIVHKVIDHVDHICRRFITASPPPIRRFARVILVCFGQASLIAFVIGPAFAQSGSQPVYEGRSSLGPANRTAWLERVEQARARYDTFAAQARLSIHPKVIEPGVAPPPRVTGILDDPTLRRGDVVVTLEGLMVFRGGRGLPHTSRDFDPVASPAAARASHAPELIELQRAHESGKR